MKAGDCGFNKGLETKKDISQSMWYKKGKKLREYHDIQRIQTQNNPSTRPQQYLPSGAQTQLGRNGQGRLSQSPSQIQTSQVGKPSFNIQTAQENWFPYTRAASQTALHVAEDERGGG